MNRWQEPKPEQSSDGSVAAEKVSVVLNRIN